MNDVFEMQQMIAELDVALNSVTVARDMSPTEVWEALLRDAAQRGTHSEETMFKVRKALLKGGLTLAQVDDSITNMQNAGILFRERV